MQKNFLFREYQFLPVFQGSRLQKTDKQLSIFLFPQTAFPEIWNPYMASTRVVCQDGIEKKNWIYFLADPVQLQRSSSLWNIDTGNRLHVPWMKQNSNPSIADNADEWDPILLNAFREFHEN